MASEGTSLLPPLFGDGRGRYRIHIVGNSGAGKVQFHDISTGRSSVELTWRQSTLAAELATILGIPFVSLDKIFWRPGWQSLSKDELRDIVYELLAEHDDGWIVDGNYRSALGDLFDTKATDTIYSLPVRQAICRCVAADESSALLSHHSCGSLLVLSDSIGTTSLLPTGLDPPLALYFPRICVRTFRRLLRLDPPCSPGCEESLQGIFFSRDSILWWCWTQHMVVRKREGENLRTRGIHVGGTYRRIGGWGGELAAWKQSVRDMVAAQPVPDCGGD